MIVCQPIQSPQGNENRTEDPARRADARIGEETAFATKPALARAMLARAVAAGGPFRWVTGDEAYGHNPVLRGWLTEHEICAGFRLQAPGWDPEVGRPNTRATGCTACTGTISPVRRSLFLVRCICRGRWPGGQRCR
ncbi:transposase [Streptomyces sp. TLI_146]|uniref:transposase n=1 Tax=Streptomyces sp. TLI_146 TaxID=1938858 RepID=UPI000C708BA4